MEEIPEKEGRRDTKWQEELRGDGTFEAVLEKDMWSLYGHKPWEMFRQDMRAYISDLVNFFPHIEEELQDMFDTVRSKHKKVRAWDICGTADGKGIGAEETDCLTRILPGGDPSKRRQGQSPSNLSKHIFEGDIFTKEALDPLIERSQKQGNPSVIFMIVVGGFAISGQRERAGSRPMLMYQLNRALGVLENGGHIYFQNPFYMHPDVEPTRAFERLKKLASAYGRLEPDEPNVRFYRIIKFDQAS